MVKVKSTGCEFFKTKIMFKEYDEQRIMYCDNVNFATIFRSSNNSNITDFSRVEIVPSPEQTDRLNVLNNLDLTHIENWTSEVRDFVEFGFISPRANSVIKTLKDSYLVETKKYLTDRHSSELAAIRYDREISGIDYNGKNVHTDRSAKASITSTVLSFNSGVLTQTDFKFKNGWETVTLETFMPIAQAVGSHVSKCFTAEKNVLTLLEAKTIDELSEVDEDNKPVVNVLNLFEEELGKL